MTDFTTAQLAKILSGLTSEAVLAAASGLLDGRLDPATWREQLTAPVRPADTDGGELADGEGWPPSAPAAISLRPGTKQALIADLLGREQGATLDELIAATGWLPHTTRAALTGLRRKGLALEKSTRADGKTAYHIVPPDKAVAGDTASSGVA
jgi:hypothetical protein